MKKINGASQQFGRECDVNYLMRNAQRRGEPLDLDFSGFRYADVSQIPDFISINNQIIRAEEQFMRLPAQVRREFNHNAVEFLAFISDSRNRERAEKLGLLKKIEPEKPDTQQEILSELREMNKKRKNEPVTGPT